MNGERPQLISKVLIHQSASARLYFVKDFEAGRHVEWRPISHSRHLFRFAKWSEKRFKCQQKQLGRRTTSTVVLWVHWRQKALQRITRYSRTMTLVYVAFNVYLYSVWHRLVLPLTRWNGTQCTTRCTLRWCWYWFEEGCLAWHLPQTSTSFLQSKQPLVTDAGGRNTQDETRSSPQRGTFQVVFIKHYLCFKAVPWKSIQMASKLQG